MVLRVTSFARCSSRRCPFGTFSMPRMASRVRTTGGPSSSSPRKNRATEYVEHGGAAKIAK